MDLVIFAHILLTAKGQNVNTVDSNGMTALMWAAYRTSTIDPLRLLVTLGSSLTITDNVQVMKTMMIVIMMMMMLMIYHDDGT